MEGIDGKRKRVWRVSKTFETEVGFTVEADTEEEANQLALEMDYEEALAIKNLKFTDEHINSVEEVMPTWHFTVWERLQRGVGVEAPDEAEARRMMREIYEDGGVVLDDHDEMTHGFDLDYSDRQRPDWNYIPNDDDDE